MTTDAFASFEAKLQQFADGLTDDEKQELGLLLTHAVADMERAEPDVQGFIFGVMPKLETQDMMRRINAATAMASAVMKAGADANSSAVANLKA